MLVPPRSLAFGTTLALCLVMVGNGIRPQVASAQTKQSRQIWLTSLNEDPSESVPSADGRYIGFTDWNTGELGIRDLTTGQTRLLTNAAGWVTSRDYAESSAVSPDGRQIAYAWFTTKELTYELRVMPINGGSPRTVYRPEGKKEYPKVIGWTPDGKEVLLVRTLTDGTSQLAFISMQGGTIRVLKSFGWRQLNARLSPDGRFIAYDSPPNDKTAARDVFVIATDGSWETPVVQHPATDIMPHWSPDGSRILFVSDRTGNLSLWSVEIDNGRPRGAPVLIKAEISGIYPLGITRPGTLVYISPGSSNFNIYTAELDADLKEFKPSGHAVERFLNSNSGPRVSPDGEQLAYVSSPTAGEVIVIRNLKTGKERDIKLPFPLWKRYGYGPMWFPDGRSVLVSSAQRPGISFYQVDVSTGSSVLVHRVPWAKGYQLSPDGRAIFFTQADTDDLSARLVRFDLDSQRETELKKGERFIAVAVSPDSQQVAYSVDTSSTGIGYLAVMPASGGESREVFRGSHWADETLYNTLAWMPDQKFLIFGQGGEKEGAPSTLWRVPVAGGSPQQMPVSIPGLLKSPQIDPKGSRISFGAIEKAPTEIWALENFLPKTSGASK